MLETWQETDDDGNYITKSTLRVNKEVYVMNVDGSGQTRLTNELGNDDSPSWSPDGSKIIFRSDRERDGSDPSSQVWLMNPDGTGQMDLSSTNDGDYSANWVLGWTAGDSGTEISPEATAHSVTINFDTQPQGTVIFDQYQSAIFSATGFSSPPGGCGSVVMGVTGERYSSFPNGIRTGVRCNNNSLWSGLYVSFPIPVSNLSFNILNMPQSFFSVGGIDVYQNGNYYGSFGLGGGSPNIAFPVTFLRSIPHLTGIYVYQSQTILQLGGFVYDDFTFTPKLTVDITNPQVSGGLDQTTKDALLGADVALQATAKINGASVSGGTYAWTFTGPVSTSGGGPNASAITIRSTETTANAGVINAKVTYTRSGVSVTANVTINSVLPTLTSFTAQQESDRINPPGPCRHEFPANFFWWYELGCHGTANGISFLSHIHAPTTFISDPAQSGIKYVQAVSGFRKRVSRGLRCETARSDESNIASGWQLDTEDPYRCCSIFPVQYFSIIGTPGIGSDFTVGVEDYPGRPVTELPDYDFSDSLYVDDRFEMYVLYFTGSDPTHPGIQRPLGKLTWNWGGLVNFDWKSNLNDAVHTIRYTNAPPMSRTGQIFTPSMQNMNSVVTMHGNVRPTPEENPPDVPCPGGPPLTQNPIDSSRQFVKYHYEDFLRRDPNGVEGDPLQPEDIRGWNYWTANISQCIFDLNCIHAQRINTGLAFFYSSEFVGSDPDMANPPGSPGFNPPVYNRAFVKHCYIYYLGRDPIDDPEGWEFWTRNLNSNGDYYHMIDAFQVSGEYRNGRILRP